MDIEQPIRSYFEQKLKVEVIQWENQTESMSSFEDYYEVHKPIHLNSSSIA